MSMVWDHGPDDKAELLVLLALADFCNDAGECWPSVASIARKSRMAERSARRIFSRLVDAGWLEIDAGGGRKNCNKYRVKNPDPQSAGPSVSLTLSAETLTLKPENPDPQSAEPSRTIIEPSEEDNARPKKARLPEGWVPDDDDVQYAISLKLTEAEIKEIADDFHAYWRDRTDAGGKKSARGWKQTWKNRCRDQAPRFIRNRGMAATPFTGRHGQGGGIAGAVARRQFGD